jgi:cytoskeletal protein CcmA (bactofilin family)
MLAWYIYLIPLQLHPFEYSIKPAAAWRRISVYVFDSLERRILVNYAYKFLSILVLATLLALALVTPARAFDGRSGQRVVISAGETIDDDLYVIAEVFVLDGTVNGDVLVVARSITINGQVNGSLMAAGQTIVMNGEVAGSSRLGGSVIQVGEQASLGRDLLGAGYSLETRPGSTIGQDAVLVGGQILLAGDVSRDVQAATGAFELSGTVGGNVKAELGDQGRGGPAPGMFMPRSDVAVPSVPAGLTIDPSASIAGDLAYTQAQEAAVPAGVVTGKVTREAPRAPTNTARQETSGQKIVKWVLDGLGTGIALILVGLLLLWLFPGFVSGLSEQIQARPLPSLGWGAVTWIGFFLAIFLIIAVTIVGAILFGLLTLGQLVGPVIWIGFLSLAVLVGGFVLITTLLAKVIFGVALGRWIFTRAGSSLAGHRYWPMVLGVLITVAVIALLTFPLIPGILGWLLNLAIVLLGLGALWLWGGERLQMRRVPVP